MRKPRLVFFIYIVLLFTLFPLHAAVQAGTLDSTPTGQAPGEPVAPLDTPTTLIASGVTDYEMVAPKLFWHSHPPCNPTYSPESSPSSIYAEVISRIATYGSLVRELYRNEVSSVCGQQNLQINSNIAADQNYVYWLGDTGLLRLSTLANPGDPADTLTMQVYGSFGEVADAGDFVYALVRSGDNGAFWRVDKTTGAADLLTSQSGAPERLSSDGTYLYWMQSGGLWRYNLENGLITPLANTVSGYYAEGVRILSINPIVLTHYVYIGKGHQIYRYNNLDDSVDGPLYTASQSTTKIHEITTDWTRLFFFEARQVTCGMFFCYQDVLQRTGRSGGAVDTLHAYTASNLPGAYQTAQLTTDWTHLFWRDGALLRLPNDASQLPVVNLRITGLEITQGIQNQSNTVFLIKERRTFVRAHVKSDGADVSGIAAYLYATWTGGSGGPLVPINPAGTKLTVQASPDRLNLDDSFLFELPLSWTTKTNLTLRVVLNPYQFPLEPTYTDNQSFLGPLAFSDSPRMDLQLVAFGYERNNTLFLPTQDDVDFTLSWIRRAYPLASTPGSLGDTSPGLRPNVMWVTGGTLFGSFVDRSHTICKLFYPNADDRELCASLMANSVLASWRFEGIGPFNLFDIFKRPIYYGMFTDTSGFYVRGQGEIGGGVASGPTGIAGNFFNPGSASAWDLDGIYGDWYAAHEIGHAIGRLHPAKGNACGHSDDDGSFPYTGAQIGPSDNSLLGFEPGDSSLGLDPGVLPATVWHDLMSYCANQWISDYTYQGLYNTLKAWNELPLESAGVGTNRAAVEGDFLIVSGAINPADSLAAFLSTRRVSQVVEFPAMLPGDYSLRLLGEGGDTLSYYDFTPLALDDSGLLGMDLVLDFIPGTQELQIVRLSDEAVLATQMISANPPGVANVSLQGAPNPVDGVVTLTWTASDPDGDSLTFDILYSRDAETFQIIESGLAGNSAQVDTARLGGSTTAVFRVVASDGVNTAMADSPAFTMADKPPVVRVLNPADGTQINWGQLVNFIGEAEDYQDGSVTGAGLVWRDADDQILGTGSVLSLDDLPTGDNLITLTATNSRGLSASASVNLFVDDDLSLPGPILTAAPTLIGWQLTPGTTALQTAQVIIHNAGGGDLQWTASEAASWLTLSASSGSAPGTLTLTADPSGFAEGTAHTATLTLTKPAVGNDPAQTIHIPVSLVVGDVWDPPQGSAVYLPIINR